MNWAYGVTTVPDRLDNLFPRTLKSLALAGFDSPRLFVDGAKTDEKYKQFGLEVTIRQPPNLRTYGNWMLGAWELYIRNPDADLYAMFQDDFVTYLNLRQYLEQCQFPTDGYWNLYTFPQNQALAPQTEAHTGWYLANQLGKGAVGLVFNREGLTTLFGQKHMIDRPQEPRRGWRAVDGGIVTALKKAGWKEWVHSPSLVQHTGIMSSMGNSRQELANSFMGEEFDALRMATTETINIPKPAKQKSTKKSGRGQARWDRFYFTEALKELQKMTTVRPGCDRKLLILEIGGIRDPRAIAARADGHSTLHWSKSGHDVICIDTSRNTINTTRHLLGDEGKHVELVRGDGIDYISKLNRTIDLLYLDGPHPNEGGLEFTLECFKTAENKMADNGLVLIDDCDISPGKGDLAIPVIRAAGYTILMKDRQVLLKRGMETVIEVVSDPPQPPPAPMVTAPVTEAEPVPPPVPAPVYPQLRVSRIGLVGFNCQTGLGEINFQMAEHADVDSWLVKPHRNFKVAIHRPAPPVDITRCHGNTKNVKRYLDAIDTVLFCETPYYGELPALARERNVRIVCVPMIERMPAVVNSGWPTKVDLYICPTEQSYEMLKADGLPCVYFPWPVDTDRFIFNQRTLCNQFLFLNGHGGWKGRKGADVVRAAKEAWPEMPLVVRSQRTDKWPEGTIVLPPTDDNSKLYANGDVLLVPHTCDGLGLEHMEAMASGMPVVTTNGAPWNEFPAIGKIEALRTELTVMRPIPWFKCHAEALVKVCQSLVGSDITTASNEAREWAEGRSWQQKAKEFDTLVRNGIPT